VIENSKNGENLPEHISPSDFPVGSDESRAAARALADGVGGPPDIYVVFVKPPDKVEANCHRATCGDKEFLRESGESLENFKCRVTDSLPVGGLPKLTIFWPDDDNAAHPAAT
jgi:hypothetical protein